MRSQEEVQALLKPLHSRMARIVLDAWDDWKQKSHEIGSRFARTSANVVFERIIARAIPEFDSMPGMYIKTGHQTVHFLYQSAVLFRFKRGDENGLSRNYPTANGAGLQRSELRSFRCSGHQSHRRGLSTRPTGDARGGCRRGCSPRIKRALELLDPRRRR
jgi:hypothetical protein